MGIKLIPACHFPFIFGMVFALNMSNPTRTGLRQCFLKRQTWTWTHKTHKFIYWFHESGGIKLKTPQEKCCPFAPVMKDSAPLFVILLWNLNRLQDGSRISLITARRISGTFEIDSVKVILFKINYQILKTILTADKPVTWFIIWFIHWLILINEN